MSLLGIDLGTTGCKAGVFGSDGSCIALAYREYDMLHPQPGWSELDSGAVWANTKSVIAEVVARTARDPVTALAISSFGEAFVPVTKDREILDNSILCVDDRGTHHIERLIRRFGRDGFYSINPNLLGSNYSLLKLIWLREHRAERYHQADYFLLWSDLIAFMLGGARRLRIILTQTGRCCLISTGTIGRTNCWPGAASPVKNWDGWLPGGR